MAIPLAPFYSQADQDIYASGNKFIPQEQYRLGPYTPPAIMGQNTNAGIASTGAVNPYKWPWPIPTGDGGAGDVSGTQVTYKRPLGLSPGALGGKLPGFGNWAKRTLGDVQNLYSKLPTPGNILKWGIDKYQSSKAEKEEEEARLTTATRRRAIDKMKEKYKDPNYIPPTTGGGGDVIQTPPTNGTTGGGYEPANVGQQTTGRSDPSWEHDPFAQGGRIGYERGRVVNPGGYAGYLDRNIANLEAALKYSDLTPEDRAQVEADLQKALANKGGWEDKALGGDPVPKDAVKFWEGQAEGGRIGYQGGELVEDASMVEATPAGMMEENIEEVQGEPSREQLEAIAFEIFRLPLEELDEQQLMVVYQAAMEQEPSEEEVQFAAQEGPPEGIASLV